MLASVRAGVTAALVTFASFSGFVTADAANKPYQRPDLAEAAIKLEAQIKTDAGRVGKPLAQLRREADAALQRNDLRNGMVLLGQIVAVAPQESANWLRLARGVLQIRPANARERAVLLERAATAAYIAYERAGNASEEAESLLIIGRSYGDRQVWRPALDALRLSLELREVADVRALYERMRADHGFRMLDYSVDADAASPRACFQFSETLPGKRTDFSPFVAVAGFDKPALSADDRQLCVEGLKHGERYSVTLRAGLPSTVNETLSKSIDLTIYVRDRKPFARFVGKAYVLPRTGQRGIPVVSVNTKAVELSIYRIGDRNLIDTVLGRDFQRNLSRYDLDRLAETKGVKVWNGELAVESTLNSEVTTAFPVDQAVGDMQSGVYVMSAQAKEQVSDSYQSVATQWFVVSDLGLAAFSGSDGIHVFVNSLASTEPKADVEVRLVSRGNEILSAQRSDAAGRAEFEAGLARGEGALAPAMLVATDASGDYAFLSLKTPAFDLTDRGVSGRPVPAGLDAFVYTERGVYRSGETVHVTALLRDPTRHCRTRRAADACGRAARWTRIPPGGGARSGPRWTQPGCDDQSRRFDRHLAGARLHRSEAAGGGRDHLPGRRLCARSARIRSDGAGRTTVAQQAGPGEGRRPLSLWRAGLRSRSRRRVDDCRGQGAAEIPRLSVRPRRRGCRHHPPTAGKPAADR